MPSESATVRAAQTASILVSTLAGGANLALSFFVIPRLLESPTPLMLRQWANSFNVTKKVFPVLGHLAGLNFFYLAYKTKSRLFLTAGLLCASNAPYTLAVLMPTNRKLFAKVDEMRSMGATDEVVEIGAREETAKYLVDHWGILNLPRGLLLAAAGAVGLYASL